MKNLPLLIHAGYHKTASSWFQKELFEENDGFERVATGLELGKKIVQPDWFDFDPGKVRAQFMPRIETARGRGRVPVISSERFTGNPHSGGYDADRIAKRLSKVFPEAKVWYNIREQISMIKSCYKQYLKIGGVASAKEYIHGDRYMSRYPCFRCKNFEYHRLFGYFRNLFGEENVLVLPFELFASNPDEYFSILQDFVEKKINIEKLKFGKKRNVSFSGRASYVIRIMNSFFEKPEINNYTLFSRPYSEKIRRRMRNMIKRMDKKVISKISNNTLHNHIENIVSNEKTEKFGRSNRKINNMGVKSITRYGYIT